MCDDLDFYVHLVDLSTKEKDALEGCDARVRVCIIKDGLLEGEEPATQYIGFKESVIAVNKSTVKEKYSRFGGQWKKL